ncbi:hypothetical protein BDZ90DRAFT_233501 [Jaminaea rosea]|uniref:Six-hairpin glycosidase n=1 Tax=Jaminaea rosea TaxID=1569628 RepID=A0A316UPY7_9BASI|nr:hypothetical protein BDZ90DRAFT_233501 [Jaminaea rosea]PWN26371.1 hypothetical protein BDZ90DRAFT_233501 [Jaminaea rosea]
MLCKRFVAILALAASTLVASSSATSVDGGGRAVAARHAAIHTPLPRMIHRRAAKKSASSSSSKKLASSSTTNANPGYDADKVLSVAKKLTTHSWEYGILAEALLEYYNASLSVFGSNPFPNGKVPKPNVATVQALSYVKPNISISGNTLSNGDGAAGDPASLVVPATLIGGTNAAYTQAVDRQIAHLFTVPLYSNGAISQREAVAELWADAVYMFPPAFAYNAVRTNNESMMHTAIIQCSRYRQILQPTTTAAWSGLWQHIVGPQSQTLGIWATGNGWAAMGMVRVLATVKKWETSKGWTSQQALLTKWIYQILSGAVGSGVASNGLIKNYMVGGPNGASQSPAAGDFGDVTGSAMLASAAYRMMVLDPSGASKYLSWANGLRKAVAARVNGTGYAVPNVDPLNWFNTSPYYQGSPEGQSATGILAASWRDCVQAGRC